MSFRAIVIDRRDVDDAPTAELRELDPNFLVSDVEADNEVTIDVEFSSINYKDGLAILGKPGVISAYPRIPGIDLVGTVAESSTDWFSPGDRVVLNGDGIGERKNGGLARSARVRRDSLVLVPELISSVRAAAIGTAGFTAALSVLELERQGIVADAGEILVTGAAGGVGSIAIALLAARGYTVVASSSRAESQRDYLTRLGASTIIDRHELSDAAGRPLQKARWAGAIDCVGGTTLANVLASLRYGGVATTCGLAQSAELATTVLPFILRSVTLAGINSVDAPLELRERAWELLARDLDLELLDGMTTVIPLTDVKDAAERILRGEVRGRTVVDVRR